jgi:hypothetical protein
MSKFKKLNRVLMREVHAKGVDLQRNQDKYSIKNDLRQVVIL